MSLIFDKVKYAQILKASQFLQSQDQDEDIIITDNRITTDMFDIYISKNIITAHLYDMIQMCYILIMDTKYIWNHLTTIVDTDTLNRIKEDFPHENVPEYVLTNQCHESLTEKETCNKTFLSTYRNEFKFLLTHAVKHNNRPVFKYVSKLCRNKWKSHMERVNFYMSIMKEYDEPWFCDYLYHFCPDDKLRLLHIVIKANHFASLMMLIKIRKANEWDNCLKLMLKAFKHKSMGKGYSIMKFLLQYYPMDDEMYNLAIYELLTTKDEGKFFAIITLFSEDAELTPDMVRFIFNVAFNEKRYGLVRHLINQYPNIFNEQTRMAYVALSSGDEKMINILRLLNI